MKASLIIGFLTIFLLMLNLVWALIGIANNPTMSFLTQRYYMEKAFIHLFVIPVLFVVVLMIIGVIL